MTWHLLHLRRRAAVMACCHTDWFMGSNVFLKEASHEESGETKMGNSSLENTRTHEDEFFQVVKTLTSILSILVPKSSSIHGSLLRMMDSDENEKFRSGWSSVTGASTSVG